MSGKKRRRRSIIAFEMIRLDRLAAEPLHHQLYRQIRDELVSGNFSHSSSRLPSSRDSEPYGLNDQGQAVGISCDAGFTDCRGVLWEDGVAHDLNDPDNTGFVGVIDQAKDINNAGQITGRATDADTLARVAILAVPVD